MCESNTYWDYRVQGIIRYDLSTNHEWASLHQHIDCALNSVDLTDDNRIDIILNLHELKTISTLILTYLRQLAEHQPRNISLIVLVSKQPITHALLKILAKSSEKSAQVYRIVPSAEEAHEMIRQSRFHNTRQTDTVRKISPATRSSK